MGEPLFMYVLFGVSVLVLIGLVFGAIVRFGFDRSRHDGAEVRFERH